jgi:PAS domain S-box-containing protein
VELSLESPAGEVARLRRCLNDLISIMALPALWAGGEPRDIVGSLLDAMREMLRLAFVFVRLNDPEDGAIVEMMRIGAPLEGVATARDLGDLLDRSLGPAPSRWPPSARVSIGDARARVAAARLGLQGEFGVVVAGCERLDFPGQTERLLLEVAANQAALGLQQARLLGEQKRLAKALDERVEQRTSELAAANEVLKTEVAERRRAEEARREAERESRLMVDSIPGLVALLSATGDVEVVNRQLLEYFGQTLEELRQWGTNGTVHPEDLPHVVEVFTRSIESGRPYNIVQRFRRSDGVYRWFENSGFPLRDAAGRIFRWCVLLTDIDERQRAEDALKRGERELKLLIDTIPALAWSARLDGSAEFFNQHYLDFVGLSAERARDWDWTAAVHPDDLSGLAAAWQRILASQDLGEAEARLRRHDGAYRWFLFRANPLRDEVGRIVKWYGINTDIEDRKRAEEALRSSELNLRQMTETIPEMLWSATPDGAIDYCNARFLNYTGFSPEEVMGDGWRRTIHPEDADRVAPVWMACVTTGAPYRVEVRTFHCADRTYRWCAVSALPLLDRQGRILKWHGTIVDVHDWKQAQEKLRRSEAFLAEAQHLSSTGSFSWRPSTEEITWSDEVYRIFEFDPSVTLTPDLIATRIHPDDFVLWSEAIARTRTGGSFALDYRLLMPDRSVKHLHAVAHATRDNDGQLEYIGAVQDVTERKLSEQALDKVRSELAHVARVTSLGALTASITHEVNQPLSGIITNASTCLRMLDADPPDVDGARETARRTIRDGNRASDVIARLRALFSKKEFTLEPLNLNEATREVIALSLSELQRNRVILRSELADDLPIVTGDRVQLQQVILNLLRNASDAMVDVQDRPRHLVIKTEREDGDRVRLTVRDAGVGLPPQSLGSLFDAFYTTKSRGMGIGLFVSRSIIERHRGRLWGQPNEGGPGATFSFSIPRHPESVRDATPAMRTS